MRKIKVLATLVTLVASGLVMTRVVSAAVATQVSIQQLNAYMNSNSFYLSCSAITDALVDGDSGTTSYAQFSFEKNGGGFSNFGPSIDLSTTPCKVQVTSSQITEENNYSFRVTVEGVTSTTSTIYDNSGPDPVSGYYKDGLSDGFKLHYHTPSNPDFDKVIIYRGETPDFSADGAHEIARVASGGNSDMTYEDHNGTNKYYDIRALDHAGNSSSLVGDASSTTTVTTSTASPKPGSGTVTVLPREQGTGSVLGEEATPTPEGTVSGSQGGVVNQINQFASTTPEPFKWILTHKKISIGIALILGLLAYNFYRASKLRR